MCSCSCYRVCNRKKKKTFCLLKKSILNIFNFRRGGLMIYHKGFYLHCFSLPSLQRIWYAKQYLKKEVRSSKSYGDECFKVYRQLIDNYYHNLISIYVRSCMWKALVNLDLILRCFIYLKDFYPNQQYSIMQSPQYLRERSRIVQWETSLFDDARLTPQTPVTLFFIAAC